MITKRKSGAAAAALLVLSVGVHAGRAVADDGGWYVGASGGTTLSSYSRNEINDALVGTFAAAENPLTLRSSFAHEQQTIWSADVGYMFTPYLGLEASYLDLGTLHYYASGYTQSYPLSVELSIASRGPGLALVGMLPLTGAWYVDARLGAYEGKTSTSYTTIAASSSSSGSDSKTATSLAAGIGTAYVFGGHWVLRLDFLYLNKLDESALGKSFNVDTLSAGIAYAW